MTMPAAELPLLTYAILSTHIPSNVEDFPQTALPQTALPEIALPDTALPDTALPETGVCGMPLFGIATAGVLAVVSPLREAPGAVATRVEELLLYDGVIRRLSARVGLLPLRFGTLFPSRAHLEAWMTEHSGLLLAALSEVEGCVELSIRLLPPEAKGLEMSGPEMSGLETPGPEMSGPEMSAGGSGLRSGRAFLEARRRVLGERDAVDERIGQAVACLKEGLSGQYERVKEGPGLGERRLGGLPVLHFLVRREQEEGFRETYRALREGVGLRSLLTGPWPVHHYCPQLH